MLTGLAGSELLSRITLPSDDDEFMPSGGKPPLTADEIELLRVWIARGASAVQPASDFGALGLPPDGFETKAAASRQMGFISGC